MSAWFELERERIWLTAEIELRHLQTSRVRPPAPEIERVLAARRAARAGAPVPFDAAELGAALQRVLRALPPLRGPAVARLEHRLGLSRTDIDGLLIAAAPAIDPALADLLAELRGGAARRGVDVGLIGQLLGGDRDHRLALRALLDEDRPPIAQWLIRVAPADRTLQPTLDLLWILMSAGDAASPSPSQRDRATVIDAPPSWDGLVLDEGVRAALDPLAARLAGGAPATVTLCGPPGAGERELAARLAAHAGKRLLAVRPRACCDGAQLAELVRRACRDAAWLGAALYLGPLGAEELGELPRIAGALARCAEPVLLGVEAPHGPRLPGVACELALPVPASPGRLAPMPIR